MIERYSREEMAKIWELQNRFQCMLDVEIAACKAMNELGMIPDDDLFEIVEKADFDVERIAEIEATTKHDVIAFLTNIAEFVGPASRWIHYGMTSSDVLDTATSLQLRQAGELVIRDLEKFSEVLKIKAREHKYTLCIGRSHGIHAEPITFGLKFALWFDEMQRNLKRMENAVENISVGQISGAVGNYAHLSPEIEKIACKYLDLKTVNISTQVIQRDRISEFLNTIAIIGSTIEKISLEIRHLQRTEVLEAEENFSKGQKGSSAMPHKRNPIVTEQMCGLARLLRSNAMAALENNALWHERDISHSSVERIILPDSTILMNYMLNKMIKLIDNLLIYPEKMMDNINLTNGLVFSQVFLLELAKKGISREDAYQMVQRNAMQCWKTKQPFQELLLADDEVMEYFKTEEIDDIFSFDRYTENVDHIFKRVGIN
ncbi:MAG: adenylosuccinate lyase [Candidatus Cloacimonetes bacterium]|nr:adenylosuccinate lyase [Candidatus Cloacimonadota bacterium]MCF7814971.1 adenylosuccinate lyase [Candidatus Cloacimonadota bacterium]MCF7868432.1 adenylosuccinate lyase [Candidatus Cloacimonadota bacterium]MCF7883905.1 adenylosuccinate lyase [Candidatus Cloacimonadota bacterium]